MKFSPKISLLLEQVALEMIFYPSVTFLTTVLSQKI